MKNKKVERAVTIIGYTLIAALALLLAFVIVSNVTGHTVFIAGRTTAWVMTPSMEPEIPARSYIFLKKAEPSEISVGDVIMFRSDDPALGGAFNTHRVVEILGDHEEFVTKGDNNTAVDPCTAKADKVVGVYVRSLPVLTAIGRFASSGIGKVIVITLMLVILMAIYLPGIIRATRARSEELERIRKEQIDARIREEVARMTRENAAQSGVRTEQPPEQQPGTAEAEPEQQPTKADP